MVFQVGRHDIAVVRLNVASTLIDVFDADGSIDADDDAVWIAGLLEGEDDGGWF